MLRGLKVIFLKGVFPSPDSFPRVFPGAFKHFGLR
jgi:hypothetical protein